MQSISYPLLAGHVRVLGTHHEKQNLHYPLHLLPILHTFSDISVLSSLIKLPSFSPFSPSTLSWRGKAAQAATAGRLLPFKAERRAVQGSQAKLNVNIAISLVMTWLSNNNNKKNYFNTNATFKNLLNRDSFSVVATQSFYQNSSIYSLQFITWNGINDIKSLESQHLRASLQSNVCFENKITTYTVIHKYLHFIIDSTSELAS